MTNRTNQCTWDNKKSSTERLIHTSPSENSTARSNDDDPRKTKTSMGGTKSSENSTARWIDDDPRKTKTSMGGTKSQNSTASKKWNPYDDDQNSTVSQEWIPGTIKRYSPSNSENSEESEIGLDDDKTSKTVVTSKQNSTASKKKIAGARKSHSGILVTEKTTREGKTSTSSPSTSSPALNTRRRVKF